MLLSLFALAMAAPQCAPQIVLPAGLTGWKRTAEGLDTRHATALSARDGKVETRVTIRKPGVFGIALDRDGWIDVAPARGKPLRMASENRGPRCSGIRKIVRFRLNAGDYRVTVSKLGAGQARLMLVRGAARSRFARIGGSG
ncbi:hypothetical protein [Sphingomonas sp.]|jgi:hypothetical protein|uniref:hypothetical protein n=1 Tax=Sphingomonas sp. TaxID=28214 RepID=UPI002EDBAD09